MRILLRFQVKCKLTKAWEPKNSLSSLKCCVIIYPIVELCNSVRAIRFFECDRSAFCRLAVAQEKKWCNPYVLDHVSECDRKYIKRCKLRK